MGLREKEIKDKGLRDLLKLKNKLKGQLENLKTRRFTTQKNNKKVNESYVKYRDLSFIIDELSSTNN